MCVSTALFCNFQHLCYTLHGSVDATCFDVICFQRETGFTFLPPPPFFIAFGQAFRVDAKEK